MSYPTLWPHEALKQFWETKQIDEGATQPHVQSLLYHLVCALDAKHVVELGCWKGATSRWLACAVAANGGGSITLVDRDPENVTLATQRIGELNLKNVEVMGVPEQTLDFLPTLKDRTDFVFLDDDKGSIPEKLKMIQDQCHPVVAVHDAETVEKDLEVGIILRVPQNPNGGHLGLVVL